MNPSNYEIYLSWFRTTLLIAVAETEWKFEPWLACEGSARSDRLDILGKGYVFKEIKNSFQAFHPQKEDNATEYFRRKRNREQKIYGADFSPDSKVADEIATV